MKEKVVVLILSYNGKDLLKEAISSYLSNNYKNFNLVVIDNGSTDGTKEYVEKNWKEATVIRTEKNLGYSGGFNFGLDYAFNNQNADYVLITNNDVKADSKVIRSLVEVAQSDDNIGFVTGKVYFYEHPDILQTTGKVSDPLLWKGSHIGNKEKDEGQYDQIAERDWCDDIFWLVSRKVYKELGGYDTTFFLQGEDFDWQARAKKAGYKIYYTPYAKIWHKDSITIGKTSPMKAYYDARNPMLVILKHREPEFFRKYFWRHFRKGICLPTIKIILKKFAVKKAFKMWQGFFSGIIWGFRNNKFTFKHFIKI